MWSSRIHSLRLLRSHDTKVDNKTWDVTLNDDVLVDGGPTVWEAHKVKQRKRKRREQDESPDEGDEAEGDVFLPTLSHESDSLKDIVTAGYRKLENVDEFVDFTNAANTLVSQAALRTFDIASQVSMREQCRM
jgi:hypothetical protein